MSDYLKTKVMEFMQGHVGKANAIHGKKLLSLLALSFPDYRLVDLERDMRIVISGEDEEDEGRRESRVCSCSKGYYLPANDAETKDALRYLDSYIVALAKRKRALLRAYPSAGEMAQQELPNMEGVA